MTETIRCLVCKKNVKGDSALVLMSTGLRVWTETNAPTLPDAQNQGWFEVGPDCARRIARTGAEGFDLRSAR